MRIAVLIEDRCKPNSNAFEYLKNGQAHVAVSVFKLLVKKSRFWKVHVHLVSSELNIAQMMQ